MFEGRVAVLFACALTLVVAQQDPCNSYAEINEPRRSQNFVPDATDLLLCDRSLRAGWYRFASKSGGMMPTKCVNLFHCGTHAPVWMQGTHPAVNDGIVTRTACTTLPDAGDGCCKRSHKIRVKNCGAYFVYYLTRTEGCSIAYCAGTATPCPTGTFSATGFPPCSTDAYPKLTARPKLTGPHVGANKQTMVFRCEVPYTLTKDANFEVTWMFDHKPDQNVPAFTLREKQRVAVLDQRYLVGNMGKTVTCSVRSYYVKTRMSNPEESDGFWVGVEISPNHIEVGEGDSTVTVTLSSTIPVLCSHRFTCAVDFELDVDSTDVDELVAAETCTKSLKTDDWDPIKKRAETTFDVLAVRDFKNDRNKKTSMRFKPIFSFSPPLWNTYSLTPTTVITKDVGTQRCISSGDPHLKGFDKKSSYHLYRTGEFVFYKSTKRPFEVHVRTWICANNVACNCGFVGREGNDVVEVDLCHGRVGRSYPKVKVKSQNKLLEGTKIKRSSNGKSFQVKFPSGAWVKADTNPRYMNLEMQAPSDDFRATQGVCGTFDGNDKNDFTKKDGSIHNPNDRFPVPFFETWRIPYGESLFDKVPPPQQTYEYNPPYCRCDKKSGKIDCRPENKLADPNDKQTDRWNDLTNTLNKKNRLRRATNFHDLDTDEDDFYVFDYGFGHQPKMPKFPTPSGRTEKATRKYCRDQILKSQIATACMKLNQIDVDTFVDDCTEDIKISDDTSFARDAVADFEKACQEIVLKDPANYVKTTDKDGNVTVVPPTFVLEDLCEDNCNFRGKCVQGVCQCDAGYSGVDCAVEVKKPGTIVEVRRPVCNIRNRPCRTVFLIVDNAMESPKFSCRVRQLKFENGKLSKTPGPYVDVPVEFESFAEVACQLPKHDVGTGKPAAGYLISITNDGKLYSKEHLFVAHDSLCMTCVGDQCSQKPNTCLISGRCYNAFDTAVGSKTKICAPEKSATSWSTRTVSGLNNWTATSTGCMCNDSPIVSDCACCVSGGCQCGGKHSKTCAECGKMDQCGKN